MRTLPPLALLGFALLLARPALAKKATSEIEVGGYVQSQLTTGLEGDNDGARDKATFEVRRARVKVEAQLLERAGFTIGFDPSSMDQPLRDAYLSLRLPADVELRVGQQKVRFGWENPLSSTRLIHTDRANVTSKLAQGPIDVRDVGLGLLGEWKLGRFGVEAALTVVNGAGPMAFQDNDDRKNVWGRVGGWVHLGKLRVSGGVSSADGRHTTTNKALTEVRQTDFTRAGVDLQLEHPWFWVNAEAIDGRETLAGVFTRKRGAYVTGVLRTPLHLGPVLRYDIYDGDTAALNNVRRRWTLGAYWDLEGRRVRILADVEIDRSDERRDHRASMSRPVKRYVPPRYPPGVQRAESSGGAWGSAPHRDFRTAAGRRRRPGPSDLTLPSAL